MRWSAVSDARSEHRLLPIAAVAGSIALVAAYPWMSSIGKDITFAGFAALVVVPVLLGYVRRAPGMTTQWLLLVAAMVLGAAANAFERLPFDMPSWHGTSVDDREGHRQLHPPRRRHRRRVPPRTQQPRQPDRRRARRRRAGRSTVERRGAARHGRGSTRRRRAGHARSHPHGPGGNPRRPAPAHRERPRQPRARPALRGARAETRRLRRHRHLDAMGPDPRDDGVPGRLRGPRPGRPQPGHQPARRTRPTTPRPARAGTTGAPERRAARRADRRRLARDGRPAGQRHVPDHRGGPDRAAGHGADRPARRRAAPLGTDAPAPGQPRSVDLGAEPPGVHAPARGGAGPTTATAR